MLWVQVTPLGMELSALPGVATLLNRLLTDELAKSFVTPKRETVSIQVRGLDRFYRFYIGALRGCWSWRRPKGPRLGRPRVSAEPEHRGQAQ